MSKYFSVYNGKNMVCGLACLLGNAALGLHGRDHGAPEIAKV